jgi:hypothetical protein
MRCCRDTGRRVGDESFRLLQSISVRSSRLSEHILICGRTVMRDKSTCLEDPFGQGHGWIGVEG